MEEIEKLEEFNWVSGKDAITIALCNTIIRKQNEIIDHLNSQAQPEEKKTLEQIREEFDKERVKEWDRTTVETYKQATQDTPEEWEEVNKDIWYMVGGKKYVNINGEEYIRTSDLEQLLEERETKAFNEGVKEMEDSEQIQADWDIEELGNIVDKIVKKLDKLNKKK